MKLHNTKRETLPKNFVTDAHKGNNLKHHQIVKEMCVVHYNYVCN